MASEKTNGAKFSLHKLNDLLSKCRSENGEIQMTMYLETFAELNKMFSLLGSIFGFVVSDVKSKIAILQKYQSMDTDTSIHYQTAQSLIQHEVTNNITVISGKPPSASRTLLRLHRSLEFILSFLKEIRDASGSQKLGSVASRSYNDTLSKHHIWLVRKTVGLALMTLPTRDNLLEKMGEPSIEQTIQLLSEALTSAQPVYDTVQELYSSNDILSLP